MNIVYCGRAADAAGVRKLAVVPPEDVRTAHQLRDWLCRNRPELRAVLLDPRVRMVLDDDIIHTDRPLAAVDEVTFMPPVSGG